jgi:hypothetical protein
MAGVLRFKEYITEVHTPKNIGGNFVHYAQAEFDRIRGDIEDYDVRVALENALEKLHRQDINPTMKDMINKGSGLKDLDYHISLTFAIGAGDLGTGYMMTTGRETRSRKYLVLDVVINVDNDSLTTMKTLLVLNMKKELTDLLRAISGVIQHEFTHLSQTLRLIKDNQSYSDIAKILNKEFAYRELKSSFNDYLARPIELDAYANQSATTLIRMAKGDFREAIRLYQRFPNDNRLRTQIRLDDKGSPMILYYDLMEKGEITKSLWEKLYRMIGKNLYKRADMHRDEMKELLAQSKK